MKAGYINYSNSYPFIREARRHPITGLDMQIQPPALLNKMLNEGDLQVSVISAFEYLLHSDRYWLLPDLSINSFGTVKSVILFTQKKLDQLDHGTIYVTPESATSAHLLSILLHEWDLDHIQLKTFSPGEPLHDKEAVLLIGDGALKYKGYEGGLEFDLSSEWTDLTGLPVVFALWAVRKDYPLGNKNLIKAYYEQHLKARQALNDQLEVIAKETHREHPDVDLDFVDYFSRLDYTLKPECFESLKLYARKCIELQFLDKYPDFSFLDL